MVVYTMISTPASHSLHTDGQLTCYEILIQPIHPLHVRLFDLDLANICILHDPFLLHTLRQWYVAVLHAPPHHQLSRCAIVLLRQLYDRGVLHLVRAGQRCVSFDQDIVLLAVLGEL